MKFDLANIKYSFFSLIVFAGFSIGLFAQTEKREAVDEKTYLGLAYKLTNYGVMVLEVAEGSYAEGVLQPGSLITKIDGLTTGNHISSKILVTEE